MKSVFVFCLDRNNKKIVFEVPRMLKHYCSICVVLIHPKIFQQQPSGSRIKHGPHWNLSSVRTQHGQKNKL